MGEGLRNSSFHAAPTNPNRVEGDDLEAWEGPVPLSTAPALGPTNLEPPTPDLGVPGSLPGGPGSDRSDSDSSHSGGKSNLNTSGHDLAAPHPLGSSPQRDPWPAHFSTPDNRQRDRPPDNSLGWLPTYQVPATESTLQDEFHQQPAGPVERSPQFIPLPGWKPPTPHATRSGQIYQPVALQGPPMVKLAADLPGIRR